VSSPLEWPGVSSTRALLTGGQIQGTWIDRTREHLASPKAKKDESRFCESERVSFSPLPCWKHLRPEAPQQRVRELITEIEAETTHRHQVQGSEPLGARRVLRLDPHGKPIRSKRSPAPQFHCASKQVRDALLEAYRCFYGAYRQAADRLRAGDLLTAFPEGAFPPPRPFQYPIRAPG
jgi:hypothetical protein